MSYLLRPDYAQGFLFPPTIEDWVPADHPARFVRDFVAELTLPDYGITVPQTTGAGRPAYDPAMLLALWLYAYLERIHSSRQLERACGQHLGVIWLAGGLRPDHNTLSNWLRDHRDAFRQLFRALVKVARELELIGMVLHALDGTKIMAVCAKAHALHENSLTKQLAQVEAALEELLAQVGQPDAEDAVQAPALPERLAEATQRKAAIEAALQQLADAGTAHRHPGEPDARMIKLANGSCQMAYNAQAVVDATHGLLVAEAVTNAECDNAQLVPMLGQVDATLGQTADETATDGGYFAGEQLQTAEERQYAVLVNLNGIGASSAAVGYQKADFRWDAEAQQYTCPQGHPLPFDRTKHKKRTNGQPYTVAIYRCRTCAACPVRGQCTKSQGGRTIERTDYDDAVDRQRAKQQQPEQAALLKRRGSLIERVFGVIKGPLGLTRWTVAGLAGVRGQWALTCLTYNLKVLHGLWRQGVVDPRRLGRLMGTVGQQTPA